MHVQIAGLPWFDREDYDSFRLLLPDRRWHRTFDEWERAAQQTLDRVQSQGIRAIKAKVRSHDFAEWCRATGRRIDSDALVAYGNEAAARALLDQKVN